MHNRRIVIVNLAKNNSKVASLTYLMDQNSCVRTLWFREFETLLPYWRREKQSFLWIKHFSEKKIQEPNQQLDQTQKIIFKDRILT